MFENTCLVFVFCSICKHTWKIFFLGNRLYLTRIVHFRKFCIAVKVTFRFLNLPRCLDANRLFDTSLQPSCISILTLSNFSCRPRQFNGIKFHKNIQTIISYNQNYENSLNMFKKGRLLTTTIFSFCLLTAFYLYRKGANISLNADEANIERYSDRNT